MSALLNAKLEVCLKEKNCYEAHQIYRTMYYRMARANKFEETYNKMLEGALNMFELGEPLSGIDLGNLILDLLNKEKAGKALVELKEATIVNDLGSIFEKILPDSQEREAFTTKVLTTPCLKNSKAILRSKFANFYWKEKNYDLARKHFLHSTDSGDQMAKFLLEFQTTQGTPEDIDVTIALFVLQLLVIKRFDDARSTFFNYVEKHPKIGQNKPNFPTPLLNFIFFLLTSAKDPQTQQDLPKTFMSLCKLHESSINREPDFARYLETIGENYFGLPKQKKQDNPFGDLFNSLMGGGGGSGQNLFQALAPPNAGGGRAIGGAPTQAKPSRQPTEDDLD